MVLILECPIPKKLNFQQFLSTYFLMKGYKTISYPRWNMFKQLRSCDIRDTRVCEMIKNENEPLK